MSFNKCIFAGRLTADPELATTASNISYVKFSLAVDRDFAPKGGEKKTDFLRCVAWRQSAEFLAKYAKKGTLVLVESRLEIEKYQKEGEKPRDIHTFVVDRVQIMSGGRSKEEATGLPAAPVAAQAGDDGFMVLDGDDDLPF